MMLVNEHVAKEQCLRLNYVHLATKPLDAALTVTLVAARYCTHITVPSSNPQALSTGGCSLVLLTLDSR